MFLFIQIYIYIVMVLEERQSLIQYVPGIVAFIA